MRKNVNLTWRLGNTDAGWVMCDVKSPSKSEIVYSCWFYLSLWRYFSTITLWLSKHGAPTPSISPKLLTRWPQSYKLRIIKLTTLKAMDWSLYLLSNPALKVKTWSDNPQKRHVVSLLSIKKTLQMLSVIRYRAFYGISLGISYDVRLF